MRYANADPVTGQAAWFDLRVRIERVGRQAVAEPQFATLNAPPIIGGGRATQNFSKNFARIFQNSWGHRGEVRRE